jgi:transcriptional regulator with XRE-family HTH domain
VILVSNWLESKLQEIFSKPGLTVQKVSQDTGIPRSYLSLIKTGRQVPSEEVVRKLARYFQEDEEEWAFHVKGKPVVDDLKRRFPSAMPRYARTLQDEPPKGEPYKMSLQDFAAAYGPTSLNNDYGRPSSNFIPLPTIERYATDALALFAKKQKTEPTFPLDAELLVRDVFGLDVHYDDGACMDNIAPNLLGCLFADGMPSPLSGCDRLIMVNDSLRFRSITTAFTILHELGHYLFHYPKDAVATAVPAYCRSGDVQGEKRAGVDAREWQASRFASELLMPKERVRWLVDSKPSGEIINLEIYGERFRSYFGVSQAAMEKRFYDLGYKCAFGRYAYANVTRT